MSSQRQPCRWVVLAKEDKSTTSIQYNKLNNLTVNNAMKCYSVSLRPRSAATALASLRGDCSASSQYCSGAACNSVTNVLMLSDASRPRSSSTFITYSEHTSTNYCTELRFRRIIDPTLLHRVRKKWNRHVVPVTMSNHCYPGQLSLSSSRGR